MSTVVLNPLRSPLIADLQETSGPEISEIDNIVKIPVMPSVRTISIGDIFPIEKINGPVKFISWARKGFTFLPEDEQYPSAAIIINEISDDLGANHITTDGTGRFIVLIRKAPFSWQEPNVDPNVFVKTGRTRQSKEGYKEFFKNKGSIVVVHYRPDGWLRIYRPRPINRLWKIDKIQESIRRRRDHH